MRKILWGTEVKKEKLLDRNIIQEVQYSLMRCKFCDSISVTKYGLTAKGKQRFLCRKCGRTFVTTDAPEKRQYSSEVIASAINQFYEASSLHKIRRQLKLDYRVMPDHATILHWIKHYTKKAVKALEPIKIKTGSTWVADETVLKLKSGGGEKVWLFDCIDESSKFLLASHLTPNRYMRDAQTLMERAERRADIIPKTIITDKLRSYLDAVERAWGADAKHLQSSPFALGKSTRSIERLHGTIKDRNKVMRALANRESAKLVMDGWGVHYNFFRPHGGLKGKTPAESMDIKAPYKSWIDVIKDKNL